MYTSGTVPYVPTSPPSQYQRREKRAYYYYLYTGLGLGVLQEPGVQPPTPSPAHTHTHPHTHQGIKSLIPLSTFHFLYSTGIYLLPGTSMYVQYLTVVKEIQKIQSKVPTYAWTIHHYLPPYLDHHYYRQYVRNLRNCRAESCKSVYHHHQTHIRVRRGVPFPTMYM